MQRTQQIASFGIVLGVGVLALKVGAWSLGNSAALFADAMEATVNLIALFIGMVAIDFAARPADENHPYGHQKAEFFAAVVEGALIIVASVLILTHAWTTWRDAAPLMAPWQGLALNGLATALNAVWGSVMLRASRYAPTGSLQADGRHLWADAAMSAVIIAGLGAAQWRGLAILDPLLAAVFAIYVLWSGLSLISQSIGGLMDAAPAPDVVERIRRLVGGHAAGALEVHDLRTRHAGRQTYLEFHLVVPGEMRVSESHAICDRIEAALRTEMEQLVITIHVEPEGKAKHHGIPVL
ncbi:cation diffusion facilitator family transporter [Acidisphaera sp. L21]|uniref:cation diffusion facilitator family transporter n=1 Tax=Acidisphaera sp. L21 TaxID=1641851 RepID=UPI00131E34A7|nr:cation diffusion facilitator family transporter [Acidisphaera sp. L21]